MRELEENSLKTTKEENDNLDCLKFQQVFLRRFQLTDDQDVLEFATDKKVMKYLTWGGLTKQSQVRSFIQTMYINDPSTFAIVHKEENKCIGVLEVKRNLEKNCVCLGYLLNSSYWNRGIMTDVVRKVSAYCFETFGLDYIEASHFAGNFASGRVLTKAGFEIDIRAHQQVKVQEHYLEVVYYSLTREQYENKKMLGR